MTDPNQNPASPAHQIVPVSTFAAVMGIAGLGLAWRRAGPELGAPPWIGEVLIICALALFVVLAAVYAMKCIRSPDLARAEMHDVNRFNFFACIPLSLMLLSAGALPYTRSFAMLLWMIAAIAQFSLVLVILLRFPGVARPHEQANPSLFLPLAGIVIGAITGVPLGFITISWLMFIIGVALWPFVIALLAGRFFFGAPLRIEEWPLLAIFLTPPALAFMSYTELQHAGVDRFAGVLFYAAVFFLLVNLALAGVYRRLPYSMAWWAFTFPAAALASAAMQYRAVAGTDFPAAICSALLAIATGLVIYNLAQTLRGLRAGTLLTARRIGP